MATDQKNSESLPMENIVLVGRTGNGKSATGNSIVGKKVFVSKSHATGVTMECKSAIVEIPKGPKLNVIDTPGLFDLTSSADYISKEIINCLHLAEGGLHALLLVLTVRNRMTKDEEVVLSTLEVLFGRNIVDYLIVVFTAGDELEDDEVTIEDYLDGCPEFLKRLLVACGQRKVVFENKTKDEAKKTKQVHDLLVNIDLVRKHNNYKPYTEEMYLKIKEEKDRHEKEKEEHAKQGHSEEKFEELLKEMMLINQQNLKSMSDMMEKNMRLALEAQEKLFEHREKEEEERHLADEQRHQQEMQQVLNQMQGNMRSEMEAQMNRGHGCNIL